MVKKKIRNTLKKFKRLLESDGLSVDKLLLYGSYARGTARKDSDIDVCVISKSFGKNRLNEKFYLLHKAPKIDPRIEPVAFSTKDYRQNFVSPLLHQIRNEGIEIK